MVLMWVRGGCALLGLHFSSSACCPSWACTFGTWPRALSEPASAGRIDSVAPFGVSSPLKPIACDFMLVIGLMAGGRGRWWQHVPWGKAEAPESKEEAHTGGSGDGPVRRPMGFRVLRL